MHCVTPINKTTQLVKLLHSSLEELAESTQMGVTLLGCEGSIIDASPPHSPCFPVSKLARTPHFLRQQHRLPTTSALSVTTLTCKGSAVFFSVPILADDNQCATLIVGPCRLSASPHHPPLACPNACGDCTEKSFPFISSQERPWLCALLKTSATVIGLKLDADSQQRANRKLKESHRYLEGFFEAAPLGLLVSQNKTMLKVNKRFCEMSGYTSEELLSSNDYHLYLSENEHERVYRELSYAMQQEGKGQAEAKCVSKDGLIRDIILYAAPLDSQDIQAGAAVVVQDITEQKCNEAALRSSRDKLESLFRAVPVGLAIIRDRHLYSFNEQMSFITGYDMDELSLMHVRRLYKSQEEYDRVGQAIYTTLWQTGRSDMETTLLRKDGILRDLLISVTPIDIQNRAAGVAVACQDITQQKKNEQALVRQRAMLQSLFNAVPVGLAILKNRTFAAVNSPLAEMLGHTPEALIDMPTRKFYRSNEEYHRIGRELYEKLWRSETHNTLETQLVAADGSVRDVSFSAAAIDLHNPLAGAAVAIYDITQQKRTQKQLQQNETRFRTIAEFTGQILYDYDITSGAITWTGKTDEMTGLPLEVMNQQGIEGWFALVHADDRERVLSELERAIKTQSLFQSAYALQKSAGSYINVEEEGVPFYDDENTPTHMIGIVRDVTSRVAAERQRKASDQRFRTLFESAGNALFVLRDDVIVNCNKQALKLFRCGRNDLLGKTPLSLSPAHQEDGTLSHDNYVQNKNLARLGIPLRFEWKHQRLDGKIFDAEVYLNAIEISGEKYTHISMRDITDRKMAEKGLRESEFRFRSFYNTNPEGIVLLNFEGFALDANKAFLRESGYTLDQCVGHHFREFVKDEADQARVVEAIASLRSGVTEPVPLELTYRNAQGQAIPVSIKGWLVVDNTSRPLYIGVFIKNLTVEKALSLEKAALEKQIIQAQKSEAIGTLAGGIAHDFNNILGGLMGYTQLALIKMPPLPDDTIENYLHRVLEIGQRAKDLVQQILRFSRHSSIEVIPIPIVPIVNESTRLLRSTIPSSISIEQNISLKEEQILGNTTQIHQVIMNLAINGYHAMLKTGGTLTIWLDKVRLERSKRFLTMEIPPGEYITISVQDTGSGMSLTVLERIFEPYFTTKEVNEGTGLGLAVTHGIIRGHKGLIEVETELGVGSCFTVFLPHITAVPPQLEDNAPLVSVGHGERILVVDDEEFFLEIIREGLNLLGYIVEVQLSSKNTLEIFRQNPHQYDLLITDLTMPEMTGIELASEIRKIQPTLPIILCTGYSESITEENASHFGITQLLLKPINIKDLAQAVHQIFTESEHQGW